MKSIPNLNVDIDGNVTLRNATPTLLIDNRPTTLTMDQIPADIIERVEIITNPSAKYDASGGNAGILNIVLKKNKKNGYNGSYYEFNGFASSVSNPAQAGDPTGGQVQKIPTTGSVLIIAAGDLSIPVWASSSSLGQFQLTFNVTCFNQTDAAVLSEVILFCPTSGVFITNNGVSQSEVGVLDKSTVLKAKEGHSDAISRSEAMRLLGGAGPNHMAQLYHRIKHNRRGMMNSKMMGSGSGGSMSGGTMHSKNRMC
jgi:hypothetical protein